MKATLTEQLTSQASSAMRMLAYNQRLLQRRQNQISRSLKTPGISGEASSKFTEELLAIQEGIVATVNSIARYLLNPKTTAVSDAATGEEILAELVKGKK